jgi:D-3-phosphoglycerate dehydrogenase
VKVAVTCIQLIRDLELCRGQFEASGLEPVAASVPGQHLEGDDLVASLDGCVGVVAGDDQFTPEVLERSPHLRVISKWGIGVDGINREAADRLGIVVRNTPGMFDEEVGDVTMAYIVDVCRHLTLIDRGIRSGCWPKPPGMSLAGSVLGVVGLGGIGRAVAKRALVSGMKVVGFDPGEESARLARELGVDTVELDVLLSDSDVISVNAPLNPSTLHLIDASAFAAMKHGVRLVNTGRGPVVSTDALVEALRSGKVAAAALDVMEQEPVPTGHPLREFDSVVFGSHNASNTNEASMRTHVRAIQNLIDELEALG